MRQQISFLTQSRFYTSAFNAAIFDGPVRIYFAQYQESQALKVYFRAQERLKEMSGAAREAFRRGGFNIFVMLYPNLETFQISFDEVEADMSSSVVVARLGHDFVLGISGQMLEQNIETICDRIYEIASTLKGFPVHSGHRESNEVGV